MKRLIWIVAAILLVACSGGAAEPETAVPTAEPAAPTEDTQDAPATTNTEGATETTDAPQLQLIEFYADW